MQKVKEYLKNIFSKEKPKSFVDCQDFYGKHVTVFENEVVEIYDSESMLKNLAGLYSEFEKYLELNKKQIKNVDGSAFFYHESLYPICYHLAIMNFCKSTMIVKSDDEKNRVDLVAYQILIKENEKVAKLGVKSLKQMDKDLERISNIESHSKDSAEFLDCAKVGLIFQRNTLYNDLISSYTTYKALDESDAFVVDEKRVDVMKKKIKELANEEFLTTPFQEVETKTMI